MLHPTCVFTSSPEVLHTQEQEARGGEGSRGTVSPSRERTPSLSEVTPSFLPTLPLLGLLRGDLQEGSQPWLGGLGEFSTLSLALPWLADLTQHWPHPGTGILACEETCPVGPGGP